MVGNWSSSTNSKSSSYIFHLLYNLSYRQLVPCITLIVDPTSIWFLCKFIFYVAFMQPPCYKEVTKHITLHKSFLLQQCITHIFLMEKKLFPVKYFMHWIEIKYQNWWKSTAKNDSHEPNPKDATRIKALIMKEFGTFSISFFCQQMHYIPLYS